MIGIRNGNYESDSSRKKILRYITRWSLPCIIIVYTCMFYYAYVFFALGAVDSVPLKVLFLLSVHILMILFVWSYYQTVMTPLASIPSEFFVPANTREELQRASNDEEYRAILERHLSQIKTDVLNRDHQGIRYCSVCYCLKPDRAHHCRLCNKCMLKYDHHCPWVNNCINFANYKSFVLMLAYGFFSCIFIFATTMPYFVYWWIDHVPQTAAIIHGVCVCLLSAFFAIPVACLFFDHLYLISKNQSTPEVTRPTLFSNGTDAKAYDYGLRQNFREVFGSNACLWFFPVFSSTIDGVNFPPKFAISRSTVEITTLQSTQTCESKETVSTANPHYMIPSTV
ncbi:DHHC palmitoyltransferase domain-containing protein [Ditylenchus destructor]|nr:DHHC palmitoyltransferase domain-containing protein [Ditylenchus destructor]